MIAVFLRYDDCMCPLFYSVSSNFLKTILVNKFIRIQICINGSGQNDFFCSLLLKCISPNKTSRPLTLIGSTKSVHLRSDKFPKAFIGLYCKWKPFNVQQTIHVNFPRLLSIGQFTTRHHVVHNGGSSNF